MINSRDSDVELSQEELRGIAHRKQAEDYSRYLQFVGNLRCGKSVYNTLLASHNNGMLIVRDEDARERAIQVCKKYNETVPAIKVIGNGKLYERGCAE